MKRYLLPLVAAVLALLALSKADARCYVDPFTGQKVCELKQAAVQTVKPLAIKPGERSVVVKRTFCRKPLRRCRLFWRWRR